MSQSIIFGPFRFEPDSARLWAGPDEVRLTLKAAAVLDALLARAGEPVSKEELFASVWRGTVVSDDALVTCIQELRKALGDDAKNPRFIETRHRRGYLFAAPVEAAAATAGGAAAVPVPRSERAHGATIGVLPFTDMSPGRDQDYLCEGLAEELIDALTHVAGLRVAARSSSFQFRGSGLDAREVGRQLGVGSLLEGSVRKAGDRLRITVQLIDVTTGYHQWSERFDRELGDVFAIQDEIAETVAAMLRGRALSAPERRAVRRTQTATDVYEYYLRGRQSLHRMTRSDLDHSRAMFHHAIEIDPEYAPAWAGLATAHAQTYEWFGSHDADLAEADRASRIAMELDPELADAHVARGFATSLHRQYDDAERHFEAAARIHPQLFDTYYLHGRAAFARGQISRSAELFARAAAVRPEDFQSRFLQGQSLAMCGRADESRDVNRDSIRRAERVLALNPRDTRTLSLGSGALQNDGQSERGREWAERALAIDPMDMSSIINAACLYARSGFKEKSLDLLERAFGLGWGKRDWIEHDTDYDTLRAEPRFQALMAKLK
jgi:adenylate cyclase